MRGNDSAGHLPPGEGLVRGIGRASMVALFINAVVGAGIFGLPSRVHALLGPWALLAYLACALLVLLVVLCFAEVGSRFERTGGPYLYARVAFGPVAGFQVGWLVWLTRVTAFAALCNLLLDYLAWFWPAATSPAWRTLLVTAVVSLIVAINLRGVRLAAIVANVFTIGKLVPLLLFVGVGLWFVEPALLVPGEPPGVADFSAGMLLLVFAFTGFETATVPAGEVREPRRTLPFAILAALAVIVPLYVLVQVVSIGTLPGLAASTRPLADAAERFAGTTGAAVVVIGALVSIAGTLNGLLLAAPRLLFAMAGHGQLPVVFARTHPRHHTPHVAILVTGLAMLALTLSGSFLSAVAISTLTRLLAYAATCAAVPVLRRRVDVAPALFTAPGGLATVGVALAVIAWLLAQGSARELRDVAIAMALGLVLLWWGGRGRVA
ncbi:APC family permease [Luteimonas arsenica]|uniref:APC family permease n=1 Tax=Luteimonas arsenica TaxID=1586242 RepID=UPI001A9DBE10|nr:amino acid permease [Luteimonas arsenica]